LAVERLVRVTFVVPAGCRVKIDTAGEKEPYRRSIFGDFRGLDDLFAMGSTVHHRQTEMRSTSETAVTLEIREADLSAMRQVVRKLLEDLQ
jgi:hypothetical protein